MSKRIITLLILPLLLVAALCASANTGNSLKRDFLERQLRANFNNSDVSLRLADSLLLIAETHADSMRWNMHKVLMLIRKNDVRRADELLSRLETQQQGIPERMKLDMRDYRMRIDLQLTDYASAIMTGRDLLAERKPDSLKYYDFKTFNRLHNIYSTLDMPDKSNEYLEKARRWLSEHPKSTDAKTRTELECELLGAEATEKEHEGNYVEALNLCNKIISTSTDPNIRHAAMVQIALIYQHQGQHEIAMHYLRDAMKLDVTDSNRAIAVFTYANQLNLRGEFGRTLTFLDSVERSPQGLFPGEYEYALHIVTGSAYEQTGQYREASYHFGRAIQLLDSVQGVASKVRLEAAKKQMADRFAVSGFQHVRRLGAVETIFIGALIVVFGLSVWLFLKYRRGARQRIAELDESRFSALVEASNNRQTLMGENTELKSVAKETTMAMLRLAQISDAFELINSTTRSTTLSSAEKLKEIKRITGELHGSGDIWEMYKALFLNIDRSFFDKLALAHPDLTKAELRMCGYILLNMSTKEIATLTNRSIRTVETIKYNLRKKLNIEIPTEQYLRHFSEKGCPPSPTSDDELPTSGE